LKSSKQSEEVKQKKANKKNQKNLILYLTRKQQDAIIKA
jgi:hypothetical protein